MQLKISTSIELVFDDEVALPFGRLFHALRPSWDIAVQLWPHRRDRVAMATQHISRDDPTLCNCDTKF